jgi:hypothetical protein
MSFTLVSRDNNVSNVGEISKVIRKHRPRLVSNSKAKQIGVGFKFRNGQMTDTVGIVIFVLKKQTELELHAQQIEPVAKEIEGIQTDIIEIPGGFRLRNPAPDDSRHRPITGGVAAINYKEHGTGTLGLIVKRRSSSSSSSRGRRSTSSSDKLYGLTNNHVGANEDVQGLSPPAAKKGDYWTHPGAHGGGTVPADVIAKLYSWNRMKPTAPGVVNYYDVAVGELTKKRSSATEATSYEIMGIGPVKGIEDSALGDKVMKRGRTTWKTNGIVAVLFQDAEVEYNGYPCSFTDQIIIVGDPQTIPFSLRGDSGSVVVSAEKDPRTGAHKAKALLFAGGTSSNGIDYTIASPIKRVAKDFGLKI